MLGAFTLATDFCIFVALWRKALRNTRHDSNFRWGISPVRTVYGTPH